MREGQKRPPVSGLENARAKGGFALKVARAGWGSRWRDWLGPEEDKAASGWSSGLLHKKGRGQEKTEKEGTARDSEEATPKTSELLKKKRKR